MNLGSVVHSITSDDGSYYFRASSEWEATEAAMGGMEGAKEVLPELAVRKNRHIFTQGATWRTYLEQTGECVWGGKLRDDPTLNDGRAELSGKGWGQKADKPAGRIIYQTRSFEDFYEDSRTMSATGHWSPTVGDELQFRRHKNSDSADGSGAQITFQAPGSELTKVVFNVSTNSSATNYADISVRRNNAAVLFSDTFDGTTTELVDQSVSIPNDDRFYFQVDDNASNSTDAITVDVYDVRVHGVAPSDHFSTAAVVRDIASRLGLGTNEIDEKGFNALPFEIAHGMHFSEALDYMSLLSNSRWLALDNGTRPYMDFGRFNKRIWTAPQGASVDLLPLERYDRLSIWFRHDYGKTKEEVRIVHDYPFPEPRPFGRVRFNDRHIGSGRSDVRAVGERLLNNLYRRRWGGSAQLATVYGEQGPSSAYFVHAGDTLRMPHRNARARIAHKSMTTRGVTVDFETNYAPLDRLLERRSKRMERR